MDISEYMWWELKGSMMVDLNDFLVYFNIKLKYIRVKKIGLNLFILIICFLKKKKRRI